MKKSLFILLLLCSSLHLLSNTYIYNPPISLISVDDYTMEDWDKVPTEYLVKLKQQGETMMGGLDSIWIYADKAYLNLLVWYREDSLLASKEIVPFNVFLNADGNNKTGGYDDWFLDGNAEWMLEGFLFESNQTVRYNPAVFMWWGSMGGGITDQTTKTGWLWTDPKTAPHSADDGWGAIIPTGTQDVAYSQPMNGNKVFEIQINRSLITDNWASTFSVGFHILRVCADPNAPWEMFGVLPNPTYDEGGVKVTAMKAKVSIDTTQLANINLTAIAEEGTITGNVLKDSIIQLNVVPNDGYTFTQWSDGNKDNPRTIVLTQDTILTAIMNKICQGQCGENLYWNYSGKILSISGTGNMYNYSTLTVPWFLFRDSINQIVIDNGCTSIGKYAFAGCTTLTSITIPNSVNSIVNYAFYGCTGLTSITIPNRVTSIGYEAFSECTKLGSIIIGKSVTSIDSYAFAGCRKLYDIYCLAVEPPVAQTSSFENYNVYLHVPCDNLKDYQMDAVLGSFKYIECIGAEETPATDVSVTPSTNSADITWPKDDNAADYSIEIKKDGVVFCTLTFNAQGQLKSIAFAPGRDGGREMPAAVETASGYKFTITGLNPSTTYTYNIDTKNAGGAILANYAGQFTTTSLTAIDQLTDSPSDRFTKMIKDGQLYILHDGKTYNAQGGEVR